MQVRTRFAPSPTGYLHLGGLRTALYTYLFTRKNHGVYILRIEDTDQERLVEGATEKIYKSLRLAGLDWDEGPDVGGPVGPYIQTERRDLYLPYAQELVRKGKAYYCFCTKEELAERRCACEACGRTWKYDKHCCHLSPEEVQAKLDAGVPYVIRQNVPECGEASFDDVLYGHITVDCSELDDNVLIKQDGLPTYNFANVIDDHTMGITHVLRGNEYLSSTQADKRDAFEDYMRFGGMPFAATMDDVAGREAYLKSLFEEVYIKDIVERHKIERPDAMGLILDFLCSTTGSLTNANNIAASLSRHGDSAVSTNTVASYIGHLEDSYLFSEAKRYDIKGHSYFEYPQKYYCEDVGLRNARCGFRHQEETHIMENLIYNELLMRGYSVDVGVVIANERNAMGKNIRVAREIDFVVNKADKRLYIQSAYALSTDEKRIAELKPFSLTGDSFRKIIVRTDVGKRWFDENGILNINIYDFLLDWDAIN